MDTTTLPDERDGWSDVTARSISLLVNATGWTYEQIGRRLGYTGGEMIKAVMSGRSLPDPVKLRRLNRLCKRRGIYLMQEYFGGDGAVTFDMPEHTPNGSALEEIAAAAAGLGDAAQADIGNEAEAIAAAHRLITAALCYMGEVRHRAQMRARRDRQPVPMRAGMAARTTKPV